MQGLRGGLAALPPASFACQDGRPIAFADLWEGFRRPDGTVMMAELHDRMPVIPRTTRLADAVGRGGGRSGNAAETAGNDVLKVWPVSNQMNSPRNNGAELLEPVR